MLKQSMLFVYTTDTMYVNFSKPILILLYLFLLLINLFSRYIKREQLKNVQLSIYKNQNSYFFNIIFFKCLSKKCVCNVKSFILYNFSKCI